MVQHLSGNLARHAQLGKLAADGATDVVNGPAARVGKLVELTLYLGEIAARRLPAGGAEHEPIFFEARPLREFRKNGLGGH